MDGVEFFSAGLRSIGFDLPPVSEGICATHNKPAVLYNFNGSLVCRGCILMRQAYPVKVKSDRDSKVRLGLGCYMLITETKTEYWGKHTMPPEITVRSATGAVRTLIRDLILNPPTPPWMFVSFSRSPSPERLAVTTTNDLMRFSGKFFLPGAGDLPAVDRLDRKRVMKIHEAADLTRKEWEQVTRAHASLHSSPEALAFLRDIYGRYPKLAKQPIPSERTPEYNALRLIAREA